MWEQRVEQGEKIRVVDDLMESGLYDFLGLVEPIASETPDVLLSARLLRGHQNRDATILGRALDYRRAYFRRSESRPIRWASRRWF